MPPEDRNKVADDWDAAWADALIILNTATRIATTKDGPEQRQRTKMFHCWRKTLRLERELGWEPSPSVLTSLETVPADIRADESVEGLRTKHRGRRTTSTGAGSRPRARGVVVIPGTRLPNFSNPMFLPGCRKCGRQYVKAGHGIMAECDECDPNVGQASASRPTSYAAPGVVARCR